MLFKKTLDQKIKSAKPSIFRIIVYFKNGTTSCGTGFLLKKPGLVMTCAHVVLGGSKLSDLAKQLKQDLKNENKENKIIFKEFFEANVQNIKIETSEGVFSEAILKELDDRYDIAILELLSSINNMPLLISSTTPQLGEEVFFCGFSLTPDYKNTEYPFTVNTGIISSFPQIMVTGTIKYQYIQVNSINLGGNSGAPLFLAKTSKIIGMINGHMRQGSDNVVFEITNPSTKQKEYKVEPLQVPLSIAFATPITTIMSVINI